nr:hypothetical protein [Tanacetum cinerariifolium]
MFPRRNDDYEGPPLFDDDQYEEELMLVYDTAIEDVIEEEEGFVGKGGFGGEEDNIEDIVVVANDLCSSMIQTYINVNFSKTVDSNPHELIWLQKALSHQKLSFLSGERHALEKLYQWISKQQAEGLRVTSDDILAYIQAELESYVEEPSMGPRAPQQQQHTQAINPFTNSGPSGIPTGVQGFRSEQGDQQPRNYIFSNALSSPVRRSLQNYHISQEAGYGVKNNEHQNRDSFDSSMDADHDSSTH